MSNQTIAASPVAEFTYDELKPKVKYLMSLGYSILITGHPGVGKSTLAEEIAKELGFVGKDYIDLRPAQMDPVELAGMHVPNRELKIVELYKPAWVPSEKPGFVFLDEINAAVTKLHQSVMYQIVLEKRVGMHKFADGTVVCGAGNLADDNAIVAEMSSALNNRFAHFILKPDVDTWLNWAEKAGVPEDYRGYIGFTGIKALYNNNGAPAFPSPRSNAAAGFASDLTKVPGSSESEKVSFARQLVASFVGEGAALAYMKFKKVYSKVNIKDVLEKGKVPDFSGGNTAEASFVYALVFSCATYITNLAPGKFTGVLVDNTMKLLQALGAKGEYQNTFARLLVQKNIETFRAIQRHPDAPKIVPLFTRVIEDAMKMKAA